MKVTGSNPVEGAFMSKPIFELKPCCNCGVAPGQQHEQGCTVARCIYCGWQDISCDCGDLDRPMTTWTGIWPGDLECVEYGLFSKWGPPWIPCDPDEPGAGPDLNELNRMHAKGELVWDKEKERLVKP